MNRYLLTSLFLSGFFLVGCSSVESSNPEQFTHFSGGTVQGDVSSLHWMTERLNRIGTAADYVTAGDNSWYQSDYRWSEGELRELIRKGDQLDAKQGMVPFQIHIRFNKDGEAVYQQYRLQSKVLPLQYDQLERFKEEAHNVVESVKVRSRNGQSLIQGYWDGESFEACDGDEFATIEFNQSLPKLVIDRLASVESYIAFIGKEPRNSVTVDELLLLKEDDFDCVQRPQFIAE